MPPRDIARPQASASGRPRRVLVRARRPQGSPGRGGRLPTPRQAHPAFLVEDVRSMAEAIAAAGHRVVGDEPLEGYDRVYVSDLFGNRVELMHPVR